MWCLRNKLYKLACNWTDQCIFQKHQSHMQYKKEQQFCYFKNNLSDIGFKFYSTCLYVQISNWNPDLTEADVYFQRKVPVQKKRKKNIHKLKSLVLTQLGLYIKKENAHQTHISSLKKLTYVILNQFWKAPPPPYKGTTLVLLDPVS